MEVLALWQIQSVNAVAGQSLNSIIFLYVVLCCIIKRPVFLLAFLIPEFMFSAAAFDFMTTGQLYTMEIIIYSYIFPRCPTNRTKVFCSVIMLTALLFGYDNFFYGINGYYGKSQTVVYQNIEYINLFAHIFFISSFVSIGRVRDGLRRFINDVVRIAANSDYMHIVRYNVSKIRNGTI